MRAYLLRSVDFGDADRVLTFYTDERGKVAAIAKGVRRASKRFQASVPAFAELEVELKKTSGDLSRLNEAKVVLAHEKALTSLAQMEAFGRLLRLVDRVCREEDIDSRIFTVLRAAGAISELPAPTDDAWLALDVRLLALVGMMPALDACARCGKKPALDRAAYFDSHAGGIVCRACGGGRLIVSAKDRAFLSAAKRGDIPTEDQAFAGGAAGKAIAAFLVAQRLRTETNA